MPRTLGRQDGRAGGKRSGEGGEKDEGEEGRGAREEGGTREGLWRGRQGRRGEQEDGDEGRRQMTLAIQPQTLNGDDEDLGNAEDPDEQQEEGTEAGNRSKAIRARDGEEVEGGLRISLAPLRLGRSDTIDVRPEAYRVPDARFCGKACPSGHLNRRSPTLFLLPASQLIPFSPPRAIDPTSPPT